MLIVMISHTFVIISTSIYFIYGMMKYSPKIGYASSASINIINLILAFVLYYEEDVLGVAFITFWGFFNLYAVYMITLSDKYTLEDIAKSTYPKKIPKQLCNLIYIFTNLFLIFVLYEYIVD